jgi:CRP-like cAMP-binding protein
MHLEESKNVLRTSELFSDLNDIHLDLILMVCEEINYPADEVIFRQDDPGDALYIIAHGNVDIILEPDDPGGNSLHVATLTKGATFGETVLVEEGHRSATARTTETTDLLRIPRERLVTLTEDYPEIGFKIMRRIAADLMEKLHTANMNLRQRIT